MPEGEGSSQVSDPAMSEWVELLGLTTELMVTTDRVMEVFTGYLNREIKDRDAALGEIAKRVKAYWSARNSMIEYAQGKAALLEHDKRPPGAAS